MNNNSPGGMTYLMGMESMGGNAGKEGMGINFYYNKKSGEIIYFGNPQHVPPKIRGNSNNVGGSFLILIKIKVVNKSINWKHKIVKIFYSSEDSKEARINLSLTAGVYNELRQKKEKLRAA